ncbi:MAG: hypothetical protein AABX96_02540 [Nanoarchaeota archaeon]
MGSVIQSVGTYFPSGILTNQDLEKILALSGEKTSDEWIVERTGIHKRRFASGLETVESMAVEASLDAIKGLTNDIPPIDHVIVATNTQTQPYPNVAGFVTRELHKIYPSLIKENAGGTDPYGGCGAINIVFMYADGLVKSKIKKTVLVIGSEKLTDHVDYSQRKTCIILGDGASAYIISGADDEAGFRGHCDSSNGASRDVIYCNDQLKVSLQEALVAVAENRTPKKEFGKVLHMEGIKVYKYVTRQWQKIIEGFVDNSDLNPDRISFEELLGITGHLYNFRGFEEVEKTHPGFLKKCGLTDRRDVEENFYNSSNASQGRRAKQLLEIVSPGGYFFMYGYGAGFQSCANLYRQPIDL